MNNTINESEDSKCDTVNSQENPYAYLDRNDFTSERFKIEVRGLPKFYGVGEFKKLLNDKMKLKVVKVKPPRKGSGWMYVSFNDEETRQAAIEKINNFKWKKSTLTAQVSKAAPDPLIKRKLEMNKKEENTKVPKLTPEEQVKQTTTPLVHMEYNEQLKVKNDSIRKVIDKIGNVISQENQGFSEYIKKQKSKYNNLICELSSTLHTDKINNYRNKCEFTIGYNAEGKIIVGFRLSSYANGSCEIGPIDDLCHIPNKMKTAVKIFEQFVQNSNLDAYSPITYEGFWKQITVRTSHLNHLMLIIGVSPKNIDDERLNEIKKQIKDFFDSGDGAAVGITSLYFQTMKRKEANGKGGNNIEHLSGSEYIEETLLGKTFQISPESFFQVNTLGAELMYQTAIDLVKPTKDTTILDICCGTGTIGLSFSQYCGEVLGLEVIPDAIKNARQNAVINKVDNCEFFIGEAEQILPPVICRATKPEIVAVVDPPRAGLHQRAICALRRCQKVKKLIYMSCDINAAMGNIIDLARSTSKRYSGDPFMPTKAIPVDMFPHTKHCELILLLERISASEPSDNKM